VTKFLDAIGYDADAGSLGSGDRRFQFGTSASFGLRHGT
jgi:hypothetical protein